MAQFWAMNTDITRWLIAEAILNTHGGTPEAAWEVAGTVDTADLRQVFIDTHMQSSPIGQSVLASQR